MGWESRNGRGRYYTRSRKVNGRFVREYIGCGIEAELAAHADEDARQARKARQAAQRRERSEARELDRQLDRQLDELCQSTDRVLRAELVVAGYHQHARGEWRRHRVETPGTARTVG